jgi:methylenetetrahydrofolate reductase (NADPH)
VLPVGRSDEEAARLSEPVRLTITCSPKHGPDRSVQTAARLRALGHAVTVHLAARMVRNRSHLDSLLAGMEQAGVDDIFLIGGDTTPPRGPYASAIELLPLIRAHAHGPRTIGIAAYPEGHPLIDPRALDDALQAKSALADYVTTQLCFDPDVLLGWLRDHRARGLSLPAFIGVPGKVPRRRLLEMSMRIGVGRSVRFLREQRGVQNLFGRSVADRLYDALAPSLEDPGLNITGFHYYTFNDLVDTFQWEREKVNARTALDARRGSDRAMSVTRRI